MPDKIYEYISNISDEDLVLLLGEMEKNGENSTAVCNLINKIALYSGMPQDRITMHDAEVLINAELAKRYRKPLEDMFNNQWTVFCNRSYKPVKIYHNISKNPFWVYKIVADDVNEYIECGACDNLNDVRAILTSFGFTQVGEIIDIEQEALRFDLM